MTSTNTSRKDHWENVYSTRATNEVSWFQPHCERSLRFIDSLQLPPDAAIIDVGGGASLLVDELLQRGHTNLTVLDISAAALRTAQMRLQQLARRVTWTEADITQVNLPSVHYDFWHDRAVFHFLVDEDHRAIYMRKAAASLKPGGYLLLATFAEDGPLQCSSLPVMRYDAPALEAIFQDDFQLLAQDREIHQTPFGTAQPFTYALFQLR